MSVDLVTVFKALADSSRLKIVGLLAQQPYSGEELAALLDLKASTVSHHLARLVKVGLVSAHAEGYYSVYQLDKSALEAMSRNLFSPEQIVTSASSVDLDGYDRKVLADFCRRDGRLKTIPAQRKKLDVILRYVVKAFDLGKRYSERKVNEVLGGFHEDTASLRRELVGAGLMQRKSDGSAYWRLE
jgi:biotin operon repressor